MSYLYISYSEKDAKKVNLLRSIFIINRAEVWETPGDVQFDGYCEAEMASVIDNCGCFCLVLSKASQEDDLVDFEVNLAKSAKVPFVIIQIEEMEVNAAFRYYISNKQIVKVFDVDNDDSLDFSVVNRVFDMVKKLLNLKNTITGQVQLGDITQTGTYNAGEEVSSKGRMIYEDGSVYNGDLLKGMRHGKGKMVFAGGNIYEGEYKNDVICGKGKYTFVNGEVYEGEFLDQDITGKGRYTWPNGEVYEGAMEKGVRHGEGRMFYANSIVYEGEWKFDKKHGKGKIIMLNGDVFEGNWIENIRHGKGKITHTDGRVEKGEWKNGKFLG